MKLNSFLVVFMVGNAAGYQYHSMDRFPEGANSLIRLSFPESPNSAMVLGLETKHAKKGKYSLTILPPFGYKSGLLGTVQFLSLRRSSDGRCLDHLTLRVWEGSQYSTLFYRECNFRAISTPRTFYVEKRRQKQEGFQVQLHIEEGVEIFSNETFGFEFTFTAFNRKTQRRCEMGFFDCSDFCIYANFVCDRRDNCGNWKDEVNCGRDLKGLIGICILSVFLTLVTVVMAWRKCRLRHRPLTTEEIDENRGRCTNRAPSSFPPEWSNEYQQPLQDPPPPYKELIDPPPPPYFEVAPTGLNRPNNIMSNNTTTYTNRNL